MHDKKENYQKLRTNPNESLGIILRQKNTLPHSKGIFI